MFVGFKVLRFQIKDFLLAVVPSIASNFNSKVFNLIVVGNMIYLTLFVVFTCSFICMVVGILERSLCSKVGPLNRSLVEMVKEEGLRRWRVVLVGRWVRHKSKGVWMPFFYVDLVEVGWAVARVLGKGGMVSIIPFMVGKMLFFCRNS